MYITPRQKKKVITRTLILFLGLPLTILAAYLVTQVVSRAGVGNEPREVVLSNPTSTSMTVTWITDNSVLGTIVVNRDGEEVTYVDTRGNTENHTHYVEVTGLEAETQYQFTIVSGGTEYQSSEGATLKFATLPHSIDIGVPNPVFGTTVYKNALVFAVLADDPDASVISATTNVNGNWYMDLDGFRNEDGSVVDNGIVLDSSIKLIFQNDAGLAVTNSTYGSVFSADGEFVGNSLMTEDASIFDELSDVATLFGSVSEEQGEDYVEEEVAEVEEEEVVVEEEPEEEEQGDEFETLPEVIAGDSDRTYRNITQVVWADLVEVIAPTVDAGEDVDMPTGVDTVQLMSLTDTSAIVTWLSKETETGSVNYGIDPTSLSDTALDKRDSLVTQGEYRTHVVELSNLSPSTKYYFNVKSGDTSWSGGSNADSMGDAWDPAEFSFTTFDTLDSPPPFSSVNGKVTGIEDFGDVVVLVSVVDQDEDGSSGASWSTAVIPDINGAWTASVGDLRTVDGADYFSATSGDKVVGDLLVYAESKPVEVAKEDVAEEQVVLEVTGAAGSSSSSYSGNTGVNKVSTLTEEEYNVNRPASTYYPANAGGGDPVYGTGSDEGIGTYGDEGKDPSTTPVTAMGNGLYMGIGFGGIVMIAGGTLLVMESQRKEGGFVDRLLSRGSMEDRL